MNKSQWFDAAAKAGRMLEDGRGEGVAIRYANLMIQRTPYDRMETWQLLRPIIPSDYVINFDTSYAGLNILRAQ